jgi:hypothetical protein
MKFHVPLMRRLRGSLTGESNWSANIFWSEALLDMALSVDARALIEADLLE